MKVKDKKKAKTTWHQWMAICFQEIAIEWKGEREKEQSKGRERERETSTHTVSLE